MMDMKKMMRQAQQMQDKLHAELEEMRVTASVGGGMVTATVNGAKTLLDLKIEPDVVDPEDVEMLQDLVVSAVSEAVRRAEEQVQQKIGGMIPGGLGALGGMLG